MIPDRRRAFADLPYAQQAGILCNDDRFQRFAACRCGLPNQAFAASAAAQFLRDCCRIASRRDLNTDVAASIRFQALKTEFDAWLGKIATHR